MKRKLLKHIELLLNWSNFEDDDAVLGPRTGEDWVVLTVVKLLNATKTPDQLWQILAELAEAPARIGDEYQCDNRWSIDPPFIAGARQFLDEVEYADLLVLLQDANLHDEGLRTSWSVVRRCLDEQLVEEELGKLDHSISVGRECGRHLGRVLFGTCVIADIFCDDPDEAYLKALVLAQMQSGVRLVRRRMDSCTGPFAHPALLSQFARALALKGLLGELAAQGEPEPPSQ